MDEVTGPVIAIALVLCAVFVPTAFMAGISGQFYKQFALTIAASTIISAFNSLTLSPALCALLLKPHGHGARHGHARGPAAAGHRHHRRADRVSSSWPAVSAACSGSSVGGHGAERPRPSAAAAVGLRLGVFAVGAVAGCLASRHRSTRLLSKFFDGFNWVVRRRDQRLRHGRSRCCCGSCVIVLLVYGGLMGLTFLGLPGRARRLHSRTGQGLPGRQRPACPTAPAWTAPTSWSASSARSPARPTGVAHTIDLPGYSTVLSTNISNVGGMFVILEPFEERAGNAGTRRAGDRRRAAAEVRAASQEAQIGVFGAPPVDGLGSTGGFKLQVQDRRGAGLRSLAGRRAEPRRRRHARPGPRRACSPASASPSRSSTWRSTARRPRPQSVSLDDVHTHAAGLSRLVLRQRLLLPEPQLAGQRAGRPAVPHARRGHRQSGSPQRRRATACRCAR